jgi:phosphopantetheinyl transferase
MNISFNESWLEWAVQIEEEAGCDIQAGLPIDKNFKEYIKQTKRYIEREKSRSVLQEESEKIISPEDI